MHLSSNLYWVEYWFFVNELPCKVAPFVYVSCNRQSSPHSTELACRYCCGNVLWLCIFRVAVAKDALRMQPLCFYGGKISVHRPSSFNWIALIIEQPRTKLACPTIDRSIGPAKDNATISIRERHSPQQGRSFGYRWQTIEFENADECVCQVHF